MTMVRKNPKSGLIIKESFDSFSNPEYIILNTPEDIGVLVRMFDTLKNNVISCGSLEQAERQMIKIWAEYHRKASQI